MQRILIILFVIIGSWSSFEASAQTTDEQLAAHYFQEGDFDKAAMYYEKLYGKNQVEFYYKSYLSCLMELEDYKRAEKLIKQQMRKNSQNLKYHVDLGMLYGKMGEESKSKQQYDKAVKALTANRTQIINLANAFIERNELDYALACYEKGRKLIKNGTVFNFEIATVLGMKGDNEGMINEYLDLLGEHPGYSQSIQNQLQRTLNFQENDQTADLLKTQLLKRVQKYPEVLVYHEMLIWLYIQKKQFNAAFVQTKALDKRKSEWGERVMKLGQLCRSNQEYGVAIKCYEYVVSLGVKGYFYHDSKIALLRTQNERVTNNANYTQEDLLELEANYEQSLAELGKDAASAPLIQDYAHLLAFYLEKRSEAIALLEEAKNFPGLNKNVRGQIKLELGDILLLDGNMWDASLYYAQVDKAFKHDILGHEAKFRNAKIFFYSGDFEWSQAQLDVLKSSTSKLIANDAMDLSLLITDNLNLDTILEPMIMYSRADLLLFQHKYDKATVTLDSIMSEYPGHALTDEVYFLKYKIAYEQGDFEKAIEFLENIIKYHGDDIIGDDATFKLAELYHYRLKDLEKARLTYEQLLSDYPGSLYVVEARKRYRALSGDSFNNGIIKKIN